MRPRCGARRAGKDERESRSDYRLSAIDDRVSPRTPAPFIEQAMMRKEDNRAFAGG
jgi:hypothetical protein